MSVNLAPLGRGTGKKPTVEGQVEPFGQWMTEWSVLDTACLVLMRRQVRASERERLHCDPVKENGLDSQSGGRSRSAWGWWRSEPGDDNGEGSMGDKCEEGTGHNERSGGSVGRWVYRAEKDSMQEVKLPWRMAAQDLARQQLLTELMTEQQSLTKNNAACYKTSGESKLIICRQQWERLIRNLPTLKAFS